MEFKTKYNIGDKVYKLNGMDIEIYTIHSIYVTKQRHMFNPYNVCYGIHREENYDKIFDLDAIEQINECYLYESIEELKKNIRLLN